MFKKLLVAFDGSAHSEEALRKAVDVVGADGHLTILSVAPPPSSLIAAGGQVAIPATDSMQRDIDSSWSSQLDEALAAVPDDVRGRADIKLKHGSAGPSIAEEASAGDYDLLIVGSRGHSALKGFFLGSVSLHLAHASPIPVLIIHLNEEATISD